MRVAVLSGYARDAEDPAARLALRDLGQLHGVAPGGRHQLQEVDAIRHLLDRDRPVPPVPAIRVEELRADVGKRSVDRRRDAERAIAEHVAEQKRHAAADVAAVRRRADADRRLADRVERHLLLVRHRRIAVLHGRQSARRIAEQPRHVAVRLGAPGQERGPAGRRRRHEARHLRRVHHVNRLPVVFEHAEGQPARRRRAQRRARRRDARDARQKRRHLLDRPAVDRHAVQIADAVGLGDERDRSSIRRHLRAQVLAAQESGNGGHRMRGEIQPREAQRADLERVEVRAEALGDEHDRASVGRERRLEIGERVVRQPIDLARLERDHDRDP